MEKTKIEAFFIYDADLKKTDKSMTDEEIQGEKVIYYYPAEVEENIKVSHTSMMEGLNIFVNQFSKSNIDHIVTNDNLIVMKNWYKSVCIALVVKNIYKKYKMELLICKLLHSVLNNFISIFTFLHGHIRKFLKHKNGKTSESKNMQESLQAILDDYAFTYINTVNNENLSIHNELQSFHFFPVEKHTYIGVQNLISSLILEHKQIKDGGLFFEGHLIYSSLSMTDIKIIYNYLVSYNGVVNNLKLSQYPFKKIASSAAINTNGGLSSFARCNSIDDKDIFLMGIKKSSVFMPVVTLSDDEKYKLVVFIYKGILLMLLIKGSTIKDEDFDVLIDIQNKCTGENPNRIYNMIKLNEDLAKQHKKHLSQEDTFRFFYYNSSNNSVKYSLNNKKITSDEFLVIADFHFLFANAPSKHNRNFGKNEKFRTKQNNNFSAELNFEQGNQLASTTETKENVTLPDTQLQDRQLQDKKASAEEKTEKEEEKEKASDKESDKGSKKKSDKGSEKESDKESEKYVDKKKDKESKQGRDEETKEKMTDKEMEQQQDQDEKEEMQEKNGDEERGKYEKEKEEKKKNIHEQEKVKEQKQDKEKEKEKAEEIVKEKQKITENIQKTNQSTQNQGKKWKLVYNPELHKKLFEDNSDEVQIEKIYYKEPNHPWVYGHKSLKRELFIFIDENKFSFSKTQQEVNKLIDTHFSNIYM